MKNGDNTNRFTFSDTPTQEEVNVIQKGLEDYNREQTNGELDNPGIEIRLVIKDQRQSHWGFTCRNDNQDYVYRASLVR